PTGGKITGGNDLRTTNLGAHVQPFRLFGLARGPAPTEAENAWRSEYKPSKLDDLIKKVVTDIKHLANRNFPTCETSIK
ncbi:MAG: hypothetical protein K6C30_03370, partial [Bacteroidaceae bacterium]|nr:hypothetical protein [Bacteroidaceae bacterium]